jgi:hypothetical protein
MTDWHASADLVARYTDGTLPEPDAWSLEKHLERCATCAADVSRAVRETSAATVLAEVRDAVLQAAPAPMTSPSRDTAPTPTPTPTAWPAGSTTPAAASVPATPPAQHPAPAHARAPQPYQPSGVTPSALLARARRRASRRAAGSSSTPDRSGTSVAPHPARLCVGSRLGRVLWAAGPAVRGAWLPAVLLVAVGAVVLAYGAGFAGARPLLLAVAPVVPVAGVALSYGAHADPLHEIAAATPSAGLRLLLTRTAAVLGVSLPLLTVAGLLLPASGAPGAAAWLLPGLTLTLASLALAGYVGCRTATAVTGGGWLCAVLAPALATPGDRLTARLAQQLSTYLDGTPTQTAWAAVAVLSAVALTTRRPAYDRLERR